MFHPPTRVLPAALLLLLMSCEGAEEEYRAPIAEAGDSQWLDLGQTVTLDGSASEVCCEAVLAYQWSFKQVPLESAVDDAVFGTGNGSPEARTAQWIPDVPGTYVVALVVSDDVLASPEDIMVIEMAKNNEDPIAQAGDDQSGLVGQMIQFDGTESSDERGVELEYEWILAAVPDDSSLTNTDIFDADRSIATIVPDVPGSFVLGLRVYDKTDWSAPDYATARVGSDNAPPVADAGDGGAVPPCESSAFRLNGLGSFDPESTPLQFDWTLKSVPDGSTANIDNFDDNTIASPVFSPDVFPGEYAFWLQVFDGEGWSAYDSVAFTVSNTDANTTPIAVINTDTTVSITADCPNVSGSRVCKPCAPKLFVTGLGSTDVDGHEISYSWSAPDGSFDTFDQNESNFIGDEFAAIYTVDTTHTYTINLEVSDCEASDSQTVDIVVTCKGVVP
jgi:hypothetical protein